MSAVDRNFISDNVVISTPYRDTSRYSMGSEAPMHPSRTPLHPYMTPMRDPGATPIHDGTRTPMRDRAWNPYAPMSPPRLQNRDNWEEGNPASWGTSPQYQVSEAGTPRDSSSAYANATSPYMPSTPFGQPMTPSSGSYIPGTPGGQPMTPGTGGLDVMSPVIGGDNEGPWFMPDILVDVHKSGDETLGVILEVLQDGSCKVAFGSNGSGDTIIVMPSEMEIVPPRKSDKIKIMVGSLRCVTGKLIGVDGIVRIDDSLDVKILDLIILAKLP